MERVVTREWVIEVRGVAPGMEPTPLGRPLVYETRGSNRILLAVWLRRVCERMSYEGAYDATLSMRERQLVELPAGTAGPFRLTTREWRPGPTVERRGVESVVRFVFELREQEGREND